jgi:hypothetical protein
VTSPRLSPPSSTRVSRSRCPPPLRPPPLSVYLHRRLIVTPSRLWMRAARTRLRSINSSPMMRMETTYCRTSTNSNDTTRTHNSRHNNNNRHNNNRMRRRPDSIRPHNRGVRRVVVIPPSVVRCLLPTPTGSSSKSVPRRAVPRSLRRCPRPRSRGRPNPPPAALLPAVWLVLLAPLPERR